MKPRVGLATKVLKKFQQQGADAMRLTDVIATVRGTYYVMYKYLNVASLVMDDFTG